MADKSLVEAEYNWYATRSGLGGNVPLNDHKAEYYSTKGFRSNPSIVRPINQLEKEWLGSVVGVTSSRLPDMWMQAVTAMPSLASGTSAYNGGSIDANKRHFYNNVVGSP